jgi:hypothetical protein
MHRERRVGQTIWSATKAKATSKPFSQASWGRQKKIFLASYLCMNEQKLEAKS